MPTRIDAFSPLQSLLLFQSIALYGCDQKAFDTISTKLQQNDLFRNATDAIAASEVSPDTLKSAYLSLLKEEAKRELLEAKEREEAAQNASAQPSSPRKRKIPSPVMPTIEEARQHVHLIPKIIPQLYANYRNRVIESIRHEEKTYDGLLKDIKDLERANAAQKQDGTATVVTASPATAQSPPSNQTASSQDSQRPASRDAARASAEVRKNDTRIDTIINHDAPSDEAHARPSSQSAHLPAPATTLASQPVPTQRPKLPQIAPAQRPPSQLGSPYESANGGPAKASPTMAQSPYARPSSTQSQSPTVSSYPPYHQNPVVVLPNPAHGAAPNARGPPFPATPPYGVAREPLSRPAAAQNQSSGYHSQPPYVPPPAQQQQQQKPIGAPPQSTHQSPYPSQPQYPQAAPTASRAGGVMLPPFQVQPPNTSSSLQPPRSAQATSSTHHVQQPQQAQVKPSARSGADSLRLRTAEIPGPQTPVRQSPASALKGPNHAHLQQRNDVVVSPGSTTLWKALPFPPSSTHSQGRPDAREISPLSDAEGSGTPVPSAKPTKKEVKRPLGRPRQSRGPSKTPSIAVSSGAARTRSQSLMSHADEMSVDERPSIKNEIDTSNAEDTESRSTKRGRRGGVKRKRADTAEEKETPARDTPAPTEPLERKPPETVLCVKDFKKIAIPILANIRGHKHGSIFESPIKERDAEGYHDIIKRPQDFKSIEKALGYGTKAIRQALAGEQASPGAADSNTVTLPISEELVPPKAIVNAGQLEQEIMRTLANAVMFNPGEDELVGDSREMYEHAVSILDEWRQNEKPEGDVEESTVEEEGAGGSKRRRL